MRTTTKVLAGILIILIGLLATLEWLRGYTTYECDLNGYTLYAFKKDLEEDGSLLFGRLQDGRSVAVGRYSIERCRLW